MIADSQKIAGLKLVIDLVKEHRNSLPDLMNEFSEKPFKVIDTGIHPKILGDWNKHDLLQQRPEKNKMHRFSLSEFVWVMMIKKMRQYNLPYPWIRRFKEENMMDLAPVVQSIIADQDQINMIGHSFKDEDQRSGFSDWARDPDKVNRNLDEFTKLIPTLWEGLILFCLLNKQAVSFIIDDEGHSMVFCPTFLSGEVISEEEHRQLLTTLADSHLSISLSESMASVLAMAPIEPLGKLHIIQDSERQILELLEHEDIRSALIHFKQGKPVRIEITRAMFTNPGTRLMELIMKNGYQRIELTTEDGNIVHVRNTQKTKLK